MPPAGLSDNGRVATTDLLDAPGCRPAAGLAALRSAAPGAAPAEVAAHLAGCARCQRRLLSDGSPLALQAGKKQPAKPPPLWRIGLVAAAAVLMVLSVLVTLRWLSGR